jgi:hypothetical protein
MAKANIVVELSEKEVMDAVEEKARGTLGKNGGIGGARISLSFKEVHEGGPKELSTAQVTFTWARPNIPE